MVALSASREAASNDPVTGLQGLEAAQLRLAGWLSRGGQVHAMLIGLRRLDAVNLAYGASGGDVALARLARRISQYAATELTGPWLLAKGRGGQFLLLSANPCSRQHWQLLAGALLDRLAKPIPTGRGTVRPSPRAALLRGLSGESAESMLDRLAHALDRVMAQPARRLVWGDTEGARTGRRAAQLEADLLRAIDRGEIEVLFQPQYRCADDQLIGAEALARWDHPQLDRIGAGGLFAIAERADHVAQLSREVQRRALDLAREWPAPLRLSLNITPNDLLAENFAADFAALVEDSGFDPARLTLEVTEQVLLADVGHAAGALAALATRGMRIALDDFGAGFCNFRYLKLLPLHTLKLDRAMIEGCAEDARSLAVLRGMIALAQALQLDVIAEGVESEAQRQLVAQEGCATYQGFLRAPPLSAADFTALIRP